MTGVIQDGPRRHEGAKEVEGEIGFDAVSRQVIGLAIEVHRTLGPGLLESAYEQCLCHEMDRNGLTYRRQVPVPVNYKGLQLDCCYRLDVIVTNSLIIEIKSVDKLLPLHSAQLLTYLRLTDISVGLLLNFNAVVLRDGLRRLML